MEGPYAIQTNSVLLRRSVSVESPDVNGGDLDLRERVETEQVWLEDELREGRGWLCRETRPRLLSGLVVTLTVRLQSCEGFAEFSALIAGVGLATDCTGFMTKVVSLQTALLGELLVTEVTGKGLGKWVRFVDHAVYI